MRRIILTILILSTVISANAQDIGGDYYVAPKGHSYSDMGEASDSNDGSYAHPFATWQQAFLTAKPGDVVYFRGGTWYPKEVEFQAAICLIDPLGEYHPSKPRGYSGEEGKPIKYLNYPGEYPILDCRHIKPDGNYLVGISMHSVHHITLRGLEIKNIWSHGRSGVQIQGITSATASYRTFENLKIHDLGGRGMGCSSIVGYLGIESDTTRWINCDFYNLADTLMSHPFNMSDGVKSDCEVGGLLLYEGCRFWNCSDDGLDASGPGKKIVKNCWSFHNGVNFDGINGAPVDDGNGFKLGGVRDTIEFSNWEMYNCISAGNLRFAIHALDYTPYYRNNARVYNTLFYKNEEGIFSFGNKSKPWHDTEFYNCITYENTSRQMGIFEWGYPIYTCNWDFAKGSVPYKIPNDVCTVTDDDFVSVDINELSSPRKADGSLPDVNFFKLVAGSDLIDAGTDYGNEYNGNAPDIGVFEYDGGAPTAKFTANPTNAEIDELISFDASASSDDGNIVSYTWDYGDEQEGTGVNSSHSYTEEGSYIVKLTITDNENIKASVSKTITISKPRQLEINEYTPNPTTGLVTITYFSPNTQKVAVSANFSDGTQVVSFDHDATEGENNQTTVDLTNETLGQYTITLDDGITKVSCSVTLEDDNPPPVEQIEIISSTETTYDIFNVTYFVPEDGNVEIEVFSSTGSRVRNKTEAAVKGNNESSLSLIGLDKGDYRVSLYDGTNSVDCYVEVLMKEEVIKFEILSGLPNPTVDLFAIEFMYPEVKSIIFTVKDEIGKVGLIDTYQTSKGKNKAVLNLSSLPAGNYTVEVSDQSAVIILNVTKQSFYQ
ncbi:right-handed parallel beta-helix repeat-containing protein [Carboxylicivirga sp. N1Y90]|uniref:right-handed parallel beta-helix repeat-containing protein n=1 Tax=Carboxylicivirga fragile TaxID=3417571 RepID=UPI003D34B802|nr:PKD domain-containing protein [Marinilabiliaceae bacterium N1Y90]